MRGFKAKLGDPYEPTLPPLPLADMNRPAQPNQYLPVVDAQGRPLAPQPGGLANNASTYTNENFMDYEELSVERVQGQGDQSQIGQWGVRRYN